MIQIRNVPETLHRTLKARAALRGQSLSDFLLREMERVAARPSREELLARLAERGPLAIGESGADALLDERAKRDALR